MPFDNTKRMGMNWDAENPHDYIETDHLAMASFDVVLTTRRLLNMQHVLWLHCIISGGFCYGEANVSSSHIIHLSCWYRICQSIVVLIATTKLDVYQLKG